MKIKYAVRAVCTCPVDTSIHDVYDVVVTSDRTIQVEDILTAIGVLAAEPIFQEDFTGRLSDILRAKVKTFGVHSDVHTTVVEKYEPF